jgi:hypothetical protein
VFPLCSISYRDVTDGRKESDSVSCLPVTSKFLTAMCEHWQLGKDGFRGYYLYVPSYDSAQYFPIDCGLSFKWLSNQRPIIPFFLFLALMPKKKEGTVQCPKCSKIVELNLLKPIFKKQYTKSDGKLDVPTEMLMQGGGLNNTLTFPFSSRTCMHVIFLQ